MSGIQLFFFFFVFLVNGELTSLATYVLSYVMKSISLLNCFSLLFRKRQEAKAKGVDYERVKALETQADHAEASFRWVKWIVNNAK